jgi:hypothetical protein
MALMNQIGVILSLVRLPIPPLSQPEWIKAVGDFSTRFLANSRQTSAKTPRPQPAIAALFAAAPRHADGAQLRAARCSRHAPAALQHYNRVY